MLKFDFYFITDRKLGKVSEREQVAQAIAAGAEIVQYREKELPTGEMVKRAGELAEICRKEGVKFIVNDRIDVALACDADGVHIGQGDMPYQTARKILGNEKIIGVSASNFEEVLWVPGSADYVGLGPIFQTTTKKDAAPAQGVGLIRKAGMKLTIPIIAIGGITLENVSEVIGAGADGVSAISATVGHEDIKTEIEKFLLEIRTAKEKQK